MFFLILWVENKNVLQAMAYAFEGEKYIRLSRKKDKRGKKKKKMNYGQPLQVSC